MIINEETIKNKKKQQEMAQAVAPAQPVFDEEAELARAWSIVKKLDSESLCNYLLKAGLKSLVFMGYNKWTARMISKIEGSEIEFYICTDGDSLDEETIEKYNVSESINIILRYTEVNLIIDTDLNKYKMRSILFDGLSQESCVLYQFMGYFASSEFYRWHTTDIAYKEEMLNDLFDIINFRYKNLVIYGSGELVNEITENLSRKSTGVIEHITNDDIKFSKAGRVFEIIKYFNFTIDAVLYLGVKNDIGFFREGKKVTVINVNSICSEISMCYDLSVDILPKLKAKNVDTYTFLYPDFSRLNYLLASKGFPRFKRKPLLEVMVNDKKWDDDIRKFFAEYYSSTYLQGILKRPGVIELNGVKKYGTFNSDYYNIINGNRITTDTPSNPKHTIYIFGKCVAMGRFVEDKNTIASFLQRYINSATQDYEVINYGIEAEVEIHKKIRKIRFKKGDIIIILYRYYEAFKKHNIDYTDMTQLICDLAIGNREYFIDTPEHFNHRINDAIAVTMYEKIKNNLNDTNDYDEYFSIDDEKNTKPAVQKENTVQSDFKSAEMPTLSDNITSSIFKSTDDSESLDDIFKSLKDLEPAGNVIKSSADSEPDANIFKSSADSEPDGNAFKSLSDFEPDANIFKSSADSEPDANAFKSLSDFEPDANILKSSDNSEPLSEPDSTDDFEDEFESNSLTDNPEFKKYINELSKFKPSTYSISGAIVMNCNPFTLGHQYLIEECAKKCDILYVFVVEEDKSVFSFKDRFELVKQGTSHIKNVRVMPSGSFMISTITFPEYFSKDAPSSAIVDPSEDVEIFAAHIAPALGINIRFAGEEPLDIITKQYNDTMKRILPSYGIKFEIIERLKNGGEVISASRVRKYLEEKNFYEIAKIVPEATYNYLVNLKK